MRKRRNSSKFEKIFIPVGQEKIASTIYYPSNTKPIPLIIFLTGSGGVKERFNTIQQYFSNRGFLAVAFDFRGRGESNGKQENRTLLQEIEDVKAVYKYIKNNSLIEEDNPTLFGTSTGAFVAAKVAEELKFNNLILSAPAAYLPEQEKLPLRKTGYKDNILPTIGKKITKTNGIKQIFEFTGNLLVIEHQNDIDIPQWMCKSYFFNAKKAKTKKYVIIKGVKHSVLANESWKRELNLTISNWLERLQ